MKTFTEVGNYEDGKRSGKWLFATDSMSTTATYLEDSVIRKEEFKFLHPIKPNITTHSEWFFNKDFIWNSELNYYCNEKIVGREWKLSLEKMPNSYELGVLKFKNDGMFTFKKIKQGNPKESHNISKHY